MQQIYSMIRIAVLVLFFAFTSEYTHSQCAYDAMVDPAASPSAGVYNTPKAAIAAAPTGRTSPWRIFIKNGTYFEKDTVPSNKPFIHLIGESARGVNITYNDFVGKIDPNTGNPFGTNGTQTFYVLGHNFTAETLTFSNPSGVLAPGEPAGRDLRAVALFVRGDRAAFKNVRVVGGQDVLNSDHSTGSRQYFKDCYIEGGVDFIFGSATAVFENCTLFCVNRPETGVLDGHVTASSKLPQYPYGFVFLNCDVTGNGPNDSYTLGRPWKNNPEVIFLNSYLGDQIWPPGWGPEINTGVANVSWTSEYNNNGPGAFNPRPPYSGYPGYNGNPSSYPVQRFLPADSVTFYNRSNIFNTSNNLFPVPTAWDPCAIPCINICDAPPAVSVQNFSGVRTTPTSAAFTITLTTPVDRVIYELQRSSDNVNFTTISNTISDEDATTEMTDNGLPTGLSYYRVNVIRNGVQQLSSTIQINNTAPTPAFGAGNIVVLRVGDGSAALTSSATPVFLDEYTSTYTFVRSVPLPITTNGPNYPLTLAGNQSTEGMLSRSPNGFYVSLVGYNAIPGTATPNTSTSTAINRVVGLIDYNVNINTETALTDFASGGSARSAVTTDAFNIWVMGSGTSSTGGIHYTTRGSTTSTFINNSGTRVVGIFDNQLYGSRAGSEVGSRIFAVGTGLPTTAASAVDLIGVANTGNASQYFFVDLSAAVPGNDVLYYADDATGVRKFSLVTGVWVDNGAVVVQGNSLRGLTGTVSGSNVSIFGSSPFGLFRFVDNTGYNMPISNAILSLVNPLGVSVSPPANTQFRGIALAPLVGGALPLSLLNFTGNYENGLIKLTWSTRDEINTLRFNIERSEDGLNFDQIGTVAAVNVAGMNRYSFIDNKSINGHVFYRLRLVDKDGRYTFSPTVRLNERSVEMLSVYPNPTSSSLIINHIAASSNATLHVMTLDGRKIMSGSILAGSVQSNIDVSKLTRGIYILVIVNDGKQTSVKFRKQ